MGLPVFYVGLSAYPIIFLTNNPIASAEDVVKKMARLGLGYFSAEQVLTSGRATACYLQQLKPHFRFYAIGAQALHDALLQYGRPDDQHADFVVVGEGAGLTYKSLSKGMTLILKHGAQLISTNPDTSVDGFCDAQPCVLPGGGALVAPFEVATGFKATVIGKPQPLLYEMALQQLGLKALDCLMIGDRPDTDIVGAQELGIATALVRTGRFDDTNEWPADQARPNFDVLNLNELAIQIGLN